MNDGKSYYDIKNCLKLFFENSSKNDVLLFNVGQGYALQEDTSVVDIKSWLVDSLKIFKESILSSFYGNIFHLGWARTFYIYDKYNENHYEYQQIILEEFYNISKTKNNRIFNYNNYIDQWSINYYRKSQYDDKIHYPGNLTDAGVFIILSNLCPSLGTDRYIPKNLPIQGEMTIHRYVYVTYTVLNDVESLFYTVKKILVVEDKNNDSNYYFSDLEGTYHKLIYNSSCYNYIFENISSNLRYQGIIENNNNNNNNNEIFYYLKESDFDYLPIGIYLHHIFLTYLIFVFFFYYYNILYYRH
jgi:hypothetical protein